MMSNGDMASGTNAVSSELAQCLTALYVGDIDGSVTEEDLMQLFSQAGDVVSVKICVDEINKRSLGYGYINYINPEHAEKALMELNFSHLNGKPIRVMYSHRDPSVRQSGNGNIFIKNLDKEIDHKALHEAFSSVGTILSCKVSTNASGESLGYGFVQYATGESALNAIVRLNGMLLKGKEVYVRPFARKEEREMSVDKTKFTNVFVKNISESTTEEELAKIFGEFGGVTSVAVMRNEDGSSKCFGFVNFENAGDAARAVDSLNGKKMIDNKELYVGRAQKKSEREVELKSRFEKEAVEKSQLSNLYVRNLDDAVDDVRLKELFSPFGSITSCKVMRGPEGISRGSGFVAFSSPEEACRAISEMKGKMIAGKPLYVALAQKKEDRRALLQAKFAQMRPITMAPIVAPCMPMYCPGGPDLGQHMFYGQAPPAIMPPQPGFGYQQQLVSGMRSGWPLMRNMVVPTVQQGHQGGRRGCGYGNPAGRGIPDVPLQGMAGGMLSGRGIPVGALAFALANASSSEQRTGILGENLYPLVEQLEPEKAAKVTGMLLEMDQTEVLHLLESPEALKSKVAEAMELLRSASTPAEHLASLSLNE